MVSPPWSAPAPPQASSSLLSPGRGSPAVRPKQDKQALPCAGRVSADTVAGSYHPETGGGGAEPLPRASVSWTAVGWKGACWAEIGSSLRPEQRNYPPPTPSPWQEPGTQTQTVCADLSAPEARQQPASSRLSDDGQSLHAHAGKVSGPTERAALESHSARPFTAGPARGPLLTPTLLHPLVQAHTLIRLLT